MVKRWATSRRVPSWVRAVWPVLLRRVSGTAASMERETLTVSPVAPGEPAGIELEEQRVAGPGAGDGEGFRPEGEGEGPAAEHAVGGEGAAGEAEVAVEVADGGGGDVRGSARKDVVFGAARVYTATVPGPKWKSWFVVSRNCANEPDRSST